jgi:adenylate kinase family enzyme
MKRVLVIGSGGAGKSTFAVQLAERTGLPLIHLDALFWGPGWVETPRDEWASRVSELASAERWIMDGNYGGSLDARLACCDTVIFLDVPRVVCLWRVIRRRIRFHGRSRPDMTAGCVEQLSWEFLSWIWTYPSRRRPRVLQRLSELRADQQSIVLKSNAEVRNFLESAGTTRS